jgi:hypothetical protein
LMGVLSWCGYVPEAGGRQVEPGLFRDASKGRRGSGLGLMRGLWLGGMQVSRWMCRCDPLGLDACWHARGLSRLYCLRDG